MCSSDLHHGRARGAHDRGAGSGFHNTSVTFFRGQFKVVSLQVSVVPDTQARLTFAVGRQVPCAGRGDFLRVGVRFDRIKSPRPVSNPTSRLAG